MKELSVEEKAKRYDEILARATGANLPYYTEDIMTKVREFVDYLIPELKDSEGEQHRKWILEYLYDGLRKSDEQFKDHFKCAIAWLEKQGTPAKLSKEEQNRVAKGVLTRCALSFINYLDAHKYEGKMCVSNGECVDIENAFHNAMWDRLHRYYCKYIEKQGEHEQKLTLPKWKYKKDHTPLLRDSLILNKYGCVAKSPSGAIVSDVWVIDYDELAKLPKEEFEKQGKQKPAEWSGTDIMCLENLIAMVDAKEYPEYIKWLISIRDRVQPQPKQEWSEEDENQYINTIELVKNANDCAGILDKETALNWLKSLKDRFTWKPSGEQKPLFPDNEVRDIWEYIAQFKTLYGHYPNNADEIEVIVREVIKSKSEWNKRDEEILDTIISVFTHRYADDSEDERDISSLEIVRWAEKLKSRRLKSEWKPSEEQMEALESATANCAYSEYQDCLRELIGQLKKLREE